MSLSSILDGFVAVPPPLRGLLARALGLQQIDRLIDPGTEVRPLPERLLRRLAVTYRVDEADLRHIPRSGPVVIVANHPFGILEAAVLATLLQSVRNDVRFLANDLLCSVPEIRDLLIPVDVFSGSSAKQRNSSGLRNALEFLSNGGCLVVFPAGAVSHFRLRERAVRDGDWHTTIVRLLEAASRKNANLSVVPVFIQGSNSLIFQTLGLIHERLRTLLLARELLNKRNRLVELRVGSPITSRKLLEISDVKQRAEYLRWRTYLLAGRPSYKPRTSRPLRGRFVAKAEAIAPAENPQLLVDEISALHADHFLNQCGELQVFAAPAPAIPRVLREIGRLREVSFRFAGEGTGKALDTDRFDADYLHLFAWKPSTKEIVGAYRLAGTDLVRDLYTKTLFRYSDSFLDGIGPALELGRSFVRPEYQKTFAPLLALWKGIGVYVARHPRYRVLFGPVSISNQYQAVSRELMVAYLEARTGIGQLARECRSLISHRHKPRRSSRVQIPLAAKLDVDDLSRIVSDLEPAQIGIPVLLRQYLKLNGALLGFSVDPEFSDALDGLILVDLAEAEPRLLERYLGKVEAAKFLECQKGMHRGA